MLQLSPAYTCCRNPSPKKTVSEPLWQKPLPSLCYKWLYLSPTHHLVAAVIPPIIVTNEPHPLLVTTETPPITMLQVAVSKPHPPFSCCSIPSHHYAATEPRPHTFSTELQVFGKQIRHIITRPTCTVGIHCCF